MIVGRWVFAILQPSSLLLVAMLAGTLCAHRRVGRLLLLATLFAVLVVTFGRLGDAAVARLEQGWTATPLPARIAGIVVLGGGILERPPAGADERSAVMQAGIERAVVPLWLRQRYPGARLVFTGGRADRDAELPTEAMHVAWLWEQLGLATDAQFEQASVNTRDNAVNTLALVQPEPGDAWLLVTSATHMRRALATFRKVGWEVHPYAVDPRGDAEPYAPGERLAWHLQFEQLNLAAREWIGLLVYRWRRWA